MNDTSSPAQEALDLAGIANHLGVSFWRARRWRLNKLHPNRHKKITLPDPDVLTEPPRWSLELTESFARDHGLWPPGRGQRECAKCGGMYAVYPSGVIYAHGWKTAVGADFVDPCPGSLCTPKGGTQ